MNVVQLTPYYAPAYAFGGVTRAVEGLARALAARGHTITILTTDALSQTERYRGALDTIQDGVRIVRVPNRSVWLRGRLNLSTPLSMGSAARDLLAHADLLHVHEFRTVENLIVTPIASHHHVPVVLSPHGTLSLTTGRSALKSAWDRLLSPSVARRIATVVGLTGAEADEARALWAAFGANARFAVVPNGVDPAEFADLSGRDDFRARYGLGDAVVCLFMGRLQARKGADVLIEAFQRANVAGTRLVIAGPDEGMLPTLHALADERVIFTGYLSGADRLAALAAADLFCLPATGEGLSMAALEALAAGLPALLSPGCNLPEVETSGAGLIVEPLVEPLATALRDLLTQADRRTAMGAAARALVRDRFRWDSVAAQIEAVYREALSSQQSAIS